MHAPGGSIRCWGRVLRQGPRCGTLRGLGWGGIVDVAALRSHHQGIQLIGVVLVPLGPAPQHGRHVDEALTLAARGLQRSIEVVVGGRGCAGAPLS